MNFCCNKFEKEYKELSTSENHMCIVEHERDGEKKRHFYLRVWNERNAFVPIKYCPYCGERLSRFYADDCYINTEIDDVFNIVRTSPSAYDSEVTKKKESNEAKVRRKYGLEVCCGELECLCDRPKVNDSVKFIIKEHILEKNRSQYYTIDKGGVERNYLKPISALSFGLLYKQRRAKPKSEKNQGDDEGPEDYEKHIDGWNFCPYCGKNLYKFYDNAKYANYIEGRDFDYPEKESLFLYCGGMGTNPVYILTASFIGLLVLVPFQRAIVKEAFIAFYHVFPYFFLLITTVFLICRCILFIKNKWLHVAWKKFWTISVFWALLLSFVLSYHVFGVFDMLNTSLPTGDEPYTVSAVVEGIDINEDDNGDVSSADIVFRLDNADNDYSRKLDETEFKRRISADEIDDYSIGDMYNITFKNGFFGIPMLEGLKRI